MRANNHYLLMLFLNMYSLILISFIVNKKGKHTCAPQESYPDECEMDKDNYTLIGQILAMTV